MVDKEIFKDQRNEAILVGQTKILKKIIDDADMNEILVDIINLMEQLEPEMKSSILFLDESGKFLTHAIAPSLPPEYIEAIDGEPIGPDAGSCGTAAYTGRLTIVEDITTDLRWEKYAAYALRSNLRACWSMPIHGQDGKVLGTFAMYYERVRRPTSEELELLDFMVNLAKLTIEKKRSQEAKNHYEKMIVEQNEELVKINKELDSFVYKASHDLRAPLSSILGLINLANKSVSSDSELSTLLNHMQKSVSRLDDYVKELIDHSRNLRIEKELVNIDFKEIVMKAIDDLAYMEEARDIKWNIHVEDQVTFRSDKTRLMIIVNNLTANAIRYSAKNGSAFVNISVFTDEQKATLVIEDNGIGIESDNLSKIFNMFYRASEATPGSGLGLYIVKETIDTLEGTIEVSSTPGKGTTFTVTIPNNH
jgi:signal transduction histidine kinase